MTWQLAQLRALPWRPERLAGSRHRVHDRAFISCVVLPINELLPWVPRLMCGVGQVILNMGYAACGRYMSGEGSDVSKMLALAGALDFMVSDSVLAVRMGWLVPQVRRYVGDPCCACLCCRRADQQVPIPVRRCQDHRHAHVL